MCGGQNLQNCVANLVSTCVPNVIGIDQHLTNISRVMIRVV